MAGGEEASNFASISVTTEIITGDGRGVDDELLLSFFFVFFFNLHHRYDLSNLTPRYKLRANQNNATSSRVMSSLKRFINKKPWEEKEYLLRSRRNSSWRLTSYRFR